MAENMGSRKSETVTPCGDFYVPGLAYGGICAFVPGAPDDHRRLFLIRAAKLEPKLLSQLRRIQPNKENDLLKWCKTWHLNDRWCRVLAEDTIRWYASDPKNQGWECEVNRVVALHYAFSIKPLVFREFAFDPVLRTRARFKMSVLEYVEKALNSYCDQIERDAIAAGLRRTPRKLQIEHFDWLARYQVRRETFAEIARKTSYYSAGGRQTVRKAVVKLADYLHLTLRPST